MISSPTNLTPTGQISLPHTTSAFASTSSQPHPTNDLRSPTSVSSSAHDLNLVRPRPPSADLAPFSSLDLGSLTDQSCPPLADLAAFPPLLAETTPIGGVSVIFTR